MAYNPQRSRELLLHRRRTSELAVFLMFGRSFGNDSKHGDKTGQVCTSQKCILQRARREFFKEKWAKLLDHFLIETDKWAAGAHWECVGLLRREASTMFEQVESNFSEPRMSNLIEFKGECIRCVFIGVRGEQCSPVGIVLNQHCWCQQCFKLGEFKVLGLRRPRSWSTNAAKISAGYWMLVSVH